MHLRSFSLLGLVVLVLAGFLPDLVSATSRQFDGDGYQSPQFDYVVTWGDEWAARERDATSVSGGADTLVLSTNAGRMQVIGQVTDTPPGDLLMDTLTEVTAGASQIKLTSSIPDGPVPTIVVQADNTGYALEVHQLDDVLVTVILSGQSTRFTEAQDLAQTVLLNGTPLFTGEPATALEPDDTGDATEAATEDTTTGEPDDVATEEATGDTPSEEDPRNTPTEEATGDSGTNTGSGLDGTTFTSPGFGFSLDIPDGWQVQSEDLTPGDESLVLFNGTSLITVRASNTLPLDPVACVSAVKSEAAANPLYADLSLALTFTGDMFQGADDRGAYALFTYTGDDGAEWSYFVRCEPLVADESVLVIVQDVPSEDYIAERQARRLIQISIDRP